jgi:hypothetical protein
VKVPRNDGSGSRQHREPRRERGRCAPKRRRYPCTPVQPTRRQPRRGQHPDPVWEPVLEGLLLLGQKRPEMFMQACRSVAFYLTGLDASLQRQLFELKRDPALARVRQ